MGCIGKDPEDNEFTLSTKDYKDGQYMLNWHNNIKYVGNHNHAANIKKGDYVYLEGSLFNGSIQCTSVRKIIYSDVDKKETPPVFKRKSVF